MAEFRFVMKQWRRMCDGVRCDECILRNFCDADPCSRHDGELDVIEDTVLQWAAEHPEPVYPTWGEWLTAMGVLYRKNPNYYYRVSTYAQSPIPADIAQKLCLKPKEG